MDQNLGIKPKVTVLMPVYNAELYLKEAIESILIQTYKDFEFLIINDGSTDRSLEIIYSYNDVRIRLISNERNYKLIKTLNIGLEKARGEYIVRMDADDISLSNRIEKQISFLEENKEIAACGSWIEFITPGKKSVYKLQSSPDRIKAAFIFRTEIMHPTVTIRKSIVEKYDLKFDPLFVNAEDYDFFLRLSFLAPLANVKKVLLKYRINRLGITQNADKNEENRASVHKQIYLKALNYLGMEPDDNMLNLHRFIYLDSPVESKEKLAEIYNYFILIESTNNKALKYNCYALEAELKHQMFLVTKKASGLGLFAYIFYMRTKYYKSNNETFWQHNKLIIKCILKYRPH